MGGCLSEKRFLFSYASNLNLNLIHLNFEVEVKAALSLSQSGVSLTRFLGRLTLFPFPAMTSRVKRRSKNPVRPQMGTSRPLVR